MVLDKKAGSGPAAKSGDQVRNRVTITSLSVLRQVVSQNVFAFGRPR